jgi:uncharacterized membrane protein
MALGNVLLLLFLAVFPLATSGYFYFFLGLSDWLVFLVPAVSAITCAMFLFSKRKEAREDIRTANGHFGVLLLLTLVLANTQILTELTGEIRKPIWLLLMLSFSLGYLAFVIRKYPPNPILGFRFKWIIKDPKKWTETQKFGSNLLFASALFPLVGIFLPPVISAPVIAIPIALTVVATMVYSSMKFRKSPAKRY